MRKIINPIEEICLEAFVDTEVFERCYKVNDLKSLEEAYDQFNEELTKNGYVNTDIDIYVRSSKTGLDDRSAQCLKELYELQEKQGDDFNVIVALFNHFENIEYVKDSLDRYDHYIFEGEGDNPELDAYIKCVEKIGVLDDMPDHLKPFFDFEKYYCWYFNDAMVTLKLDDNKYMFML